MKVSNPQNVIKNTEERDGVLPMIPHRAEWPYSLIDGSEMAERICGFDWSKTPLGPIESWPQNLRSVVSLVLTNRFPMKVYWGTDYIQFYNDAFIPIAGDKHPVMLGIPGWISWAEMWDEVTPIFHRVRETGQALMVDKQLFPIYQEGTLEETYFTISFSPLRNDVGEMEALLVTTLKITGQVLGERRLKLLGELAGRASEARTPQRVCEIASEILEDNVLDVPFALIYLIDKAGQKAHLAASVGIEPGKQASPEMIDLIQEEQSAMPWPFLEVRQSDAKQIDDLEIKFGPLPSASWPESPRSAFVLPLKSRTQARAIGFVVAGISPRLKFDDLYRDFFTLMATQISASMANAQAHEDKRQHTEALVKLDQAKTAFFSNVSHEFRTPLTLILGPLESIVNDTTIPPEIQAQLDIMHRNALRLLKLVHSMLDFSRIEAGKMSASYRATDLSTLTADLASNFRAVVEKAGLKLLVNCPPLPQAIYIDQDKWEKIVLNLLSNAFKYTFDGEIEVRLEWHDSYVSLIVRDTGVGIANDQVGHLFERFYRVPNVRSRTYEGAGIGLALVQELVKVHGGWIEVQSLVNKGSTFTVSIPVGKAHLPAEQIEVEPTLSSSAIGAQPFVAEALRWLPEAAEVSSSAQVEIAASTPKREQAIRSRILLADDNADMLAYVKRLLEPFHDVVTCLDGEAALKAIEENLPDLLLTDVMMPRLDGLGLLRQLRSNPRTRTLPVIMVSARSGEESSIEGLEAGADDYLVKPFSANELLARVESNLKLARIRRETEQKIRELEKMKVVGQLAGGVAHDFNSLLTVLIGRLEMLNEHVTDEAGQKILDSAFGVVQRSVRLVKQILAFARKQPLTLEPVSLNELIQNIDAVMTSTLGKGNRVEKKLADDLWPVLADINQVEIMILNLVLNSRDAMPEGGTLTIDTHNVYLEVSPDDLPPGEYVVLSISDTGIGMSEEILAQAFEPFFTTKGIGKGTGLGLSQLYGTIRQLGGTTTVHSELGKGTQVDIILPRFSA